MKVGFIGLGTMGGGMALNLQKAGFELVVNDIRKASAERHIAKGALWVDTARQVGEACEVVFSSLPGPKEMESVALSADGLLAGMKKGSTWFDLSTDRKSNV